MKVALIANDTTVIYNFRRELLAELVETGYEVSVLGKFLNHKQDLEQMGCKLYNLPVSRRGTNPMDDGRLLLHVLRMLRGIRPDVVLTYNIKPNVYAGIACQLLGIRYIPNITGLGTPVEYPGKMQQLTTRLYKLGVAGAETIFFQNSENLKFFQDRKMLSRKSKIVLLPGSGVNLQRYPLMPYPDTGKTHFLFVARVMKEKGIDLFLSAARKFHREDLVFEVVGGCDDENYLRILKEAQEEGLIVYHGQQKDMTPFYQRCSCFLYPSYYPEGMSNVLLEAAACGRPVIAANRSGCRETVDDGVTGYLVPVNDEAATLNAVEKFLALNQEARKAMGFAGRAKMEREFDRETVVQMYIDQLS